MFPHFAEEEKKAREEFYRKRGEIEGQSKLQQLAQKRKRDGDLDEDDPASIAASLSTSTLDSHHKAPTLSKLIHGYYDDAVTFRLTAVSLGKGESSDAQQEGSMDVDKEKEKEKENEREEKDEGEEKLPQIKQFYVRTTGRVTVRQLQKLIFAELIEQQMEEMEVENENPNKAVEESNSNNNNNTGNDASANKDDEEESKDNSNEKKDGEKSKKEYVVRTPEEIVIRLNGKGKPLCQDNTLNFLYDSYKIDPHTQVPTFTYTRIDKKKLKK